MSFEEVLSAELPEPRDDEPEALRRDILDELADHLACSYRRELLSGADAESARQRAFERFGNPAAIAARLWLDAMKGRIMSQRILVALNLVLIVTVGGVMTLVVFQMNRSQAQFLEHARASDRAVFEMIAKNQAVQAAMMAKLKNAVESTQAKGMVVERGSDWIPLKLKFTSGSADGPPVAEVYAELRRGDNASGPERHRESDLQGIVDFGVVQPGDWKVNLVYPANGQTWTLEHVLRIPLGGPIEMAIVCPKSPPELPVAIRVQWPRELADRGLMAMAKYRYEGTILQPDLNWIPSIFPRQNHIKVDHVLVLDTQGRLTNIPSPGRLWTLDSLMPFQVNSMRRIEDDQPNHGRVFTSLGDIDFGKAVQRVELLEGRYRLTELEVLRPSPLLKSSRLGGSFEVVTRTACYLTTIHQLPVIPVNSEELDGLITKSSHTSTRGLTIHENLLDRRLRYYIVSSGQANEWTIDLPPELIAAARDALQAEEAKVKKSEAPNPANEEAVKPKR